MLANLTCPLTAPLTTSFLPPYFDMFPNSTVCGAELLPNHLTLAARDIEWLGCSYPDKWDANCYNYLTWANNNRMAKIFESIPKAYHNNKDNYFAKFLAALGLKWYSSSELENIPEVPTEKTHLIGEIYDFPNYITVNAEDMIAPVMQGVRGTTFFPNGNFVNDGRAFFAVKVKDVKTNEVFAQTFHSTLEVSELVWNDWTTYGGALVTQQDAALTNAHFTDLAKLFNGQAITTAEGRTVRLACDFDMSKTKAPRRVSACTTISNLFERAVCWLQGKSPTQVRKLHTN